jgi:selenocysteine lyase/cysteine desulfurase
MYLINKLDSTLTLYYANFFLNFDPLELECFIKDKNHTMKKNILKKEDINKEIKNESTFLECYFKMYRKDIVGNEYYFKTHYGQQKLLYADWMASGRLYNTIEDILKNKIGPTLANTHSFSSQSGKITTYTYKQARKIIRTHVKANQEDILVTTGSGMTSAISKLIRITGWNHFKNEKPVVFITHMEHHSNQAPWYAIGAEVIILPPGDNMEVSPNILEKELQKYADRKIKIGSFTACSNVTGEITPYYELAAIMHRYGGQCFVDFAASAPYADIDMHPPGEENSLDAIFFSPHKFLGGPGACGILVFNRKLYNKPYPDNPGGGNVKWTTPWGDQNYFEDIETREDGGTPAILQVIRAALSMKLKEEMNIDKIEARERELLSLFYKRMQEISEIEILGNPNSKKIGCVSFNIRNIHYNLVVRLLNDRFGVQVRGGWSCASSFSHYLFNIDEEYSKTIMHNIDQKNLTAKPGWVRISLHPTFLDAEVQFICDAIKAIVYNIDSWEKDYRYNPVTNEFDSLLENEDFHEEVGKFFRI